MAEAQPAQTGRFPASLLERVPVPQYLRLAAVLALAAVVYLVWHWLGVWGKQGLDFSVYWFGGTILNQAGQAPSDLYEGNVDWAGGPQLPFTYPPFAALLFSLLARLPQHTALMLFNAAGAVVALWVAVRGVRYWNAKADWRTTFRSPGNCWAAGVLVLAVLNLGPWRETLAFGQINILLMGLMGLMAADLLALSLLVVALAAGIIKAASDQGTRVVAISTTALTMLLISPVSWSHHWVWVAAVLPAFAWTLRETPHRYRGMRWLMGGVLGISVLVFLSPKTIGTALGAENLNIQTPGLWIMASSAGAFCAVAIMVCWLLVLRHGSLAAAFDLHRDNKTVRAPGAAAERPPLG